MSTYRILLFALLATLLPAFGFAQLKQSPADLLAAGKMRYGVEKAAIKYEFSGKSSGTEMVYFTDYGWLETIKTDKTSKAFNFESTTRVTTIQKGNRRAWNNEGSDFASVVNDRFMSPALEEVVPTPDLYYGEEVIKRKNARKVGTDRILGRECTIYEVEYEASKLWVWKGIVLKSEKKLMGSDKEVLEAIQIDEEWKVEPSVFELPTGVKVSGMDW